MHIDTDRSEQTIAVNDTNGSGPLIDGGPRWGPSESPSKDNQERRHDHHVTWLSAVPFGVLTVSAGLASAILVQDKNRLAPTALVATALFLLCCIAVPGLVSRELRTRRTEEFQSTAHCRQMADALDNVDNKTLAGLARVNFTQMSQFVTIAQKQARLSFYASLTAASVGLVVLGTGTAAAAGVGMASAKIAAGVLTAGGAVLSGFLTRTFVRTYTMSSRQLSYYYGQPLVHCYLLHAVWLASEAFKGVPTDDATRSKLIDAALDASRTAQTHLLTMQKDTKSSPDTSG